LTAEGARGEVVKIEFGSFPAKKLRDKRLAFGCWEQYQKGKSQFLLMAK
jgi:hypothetical protein